MEKKVNKVNKVNNIKIIKEVEKAPDIEKHIKKPNYKKIIIISIIILIIYKLLTNAGFFCNDNERTNGPMVDKKPVIYLYPEYKTDISVKLDYKGKIIADYPKYDEKIQGWDVIANFDSTIINKSDNKEYSYLFWEGIEKEKIDWNIDKGFVVKGSETREFLQEILPKIGLTPKEYNEFIVYWYPILQNNPYNLISFSGKQYTDLAPLETTPKYDSILRVFMLSKPLEKPIKIEPQTFDKFERKGFTVVEWGGTVLK